MITSTPSLSVIVPVLRDTPALAELLACLAAQTRPPEEIIVADGADDSECRSLCRQYDARYLATPPGRGGQLRAAADVAGHEALWFLHADTLPDLTAADTLRDSLTGGAVGGCFAFRFAGSPSAGRRALAAMINWRAGVGMPYGDQGIFATAAAYRDAGGFADEPLFEEVPLVRGLRRLGRFDMLTLPIKVSTRRWEQQGWLRRSLANRALACVLLGRWEEALAAAEASVERTASQVGCLVQAAALAHAGREAEAHVAWAELRRRAPEIGIGQLSALVRALLPEGPDGETLQRAIERAAGEGSSRAV